MNLNEWLSDVNGRIVGDGQCWTLAQDYSTRVVNGGTLWTRPSDHAGYAIGVWDGYASSGVSQGWDTRPASAIAGAGWLAIWKWGSATAPESHIAVTLGDMGIGVDCMTQNPGVAHKQTLSKLGLAGYLVPRNAGTAAGIQLAGDWHDAVGRNGPGGQAAQAVTGAVDSISQLSNTVANVQHFFSAPGQWQRIGIYGLGILMIFGAVIYLFKDEATDIVKAAI